MELDIERLHSVIHKLHNDAYLPRRAGVTTAYLYLMLGEVWGGSPNNKYLYVGHNFASSLDVARLFYDLLVGEGIQVVVARSQRTIIQVENGQSFVFSWYGATKIPCFWKSTNYTRVFTDLQCGTQGWELACVKQNAILAGGDAV